jgi:hypothetical protein
VTFFQRWRRARLAKAAPELVACERAAAPIVHKQGAPRGRRPATMGKSTVEQAYLASAAQRAKHGS